MAKYSFWKEQWLLNDAEWVKQREQDWALFEIKLLAHHNKNEVAAFRRYFLKGEWTPGTKCEPSVDFKIFNLPNLTDETLVLILTKLTDREELERVRENLLVGCYINVCSVFQEGESFDVKWLIDTIVFCENKYSVEKVDYLGFKGIYKFPYQSDSKYSLNGFFMSFVIALNKWLSIKSANPHCGVQYLLSHWYSCLNFIPLNTKFKKFDLIRLYELFLQINNFIPDYPTNTGAKEKQAFAAEFSKLAEKEGFHLPEIQQLWDKSKRDHEDSWVDKSLVVPLTDEMIVEQQSYEQEMFRTLVVRSDQSQTICFSDVFGVFQKYQFTNDVYVESTIQTVELSAHLTQGFKLELGVSGDDEIQGLRYRFNVNSKYLGTTRNTLAIDLILLKVDPDKISHDVYPVFMLIERPKDRNGLFSSRICTKNRQFIIDAIKNELTIDLVRYFSFTVDKYGTKTIPPAPEDYEEYIKEMAEPFYDARYFPLKVGRYGLLDCDEDDFKIINT